MSERECTVQLLIGGIPVDQKYMLVAGPPSESGSPTCRGCAGAFKANLCFELGDCNSSELPSAVWVICPEDRK